jgi:hypothetical protein
VLHFSVATIYVARLRQGGQVVQAPPPVYIEWKGSQVMVCRSLLFSDIHGHDDLFFTRPNESKNQNLKISTLSGLKKDKIHGNISLILSISITGRESYVRH